ncbi:MAG: hypothetical protein H7A50_13570 [Akkermansiaceae bacterium]|nr:hypothetical protein [Akkermansiaceae bacterium]
MKLAFRLDLGLYYWASCAACSTNARRFPHPPFSHPAAGPFAWLMAT